MTDVGGIVVHYGSFELLESCLAALVPQVSCTVVVNHDPRPIPEGLRARYPSVVWEEPGLNLGFSRGVNLGLARVRTEYVVVANPDARVCPHAVAMLREFFERVPGMGLAGPRLLNPDGQLQTSSYRLPTLVQLAGHLLGIAGRIPPRAKRALAATPLRRWFGQLDPHDVERQVEMVSGALFMLRRSALKDSGPFDPGFFLYYEEKDLCRRLWNAGWSVGFTPRAVAKHQIGGSAPNRTARAYRHRALGALRYFQRHGSLLGRVGARVLLAAYSLAHMAAPDRAEHRLVLRMALSWRMACDSSS